MNPQFNSILMLNNCFKLTGMVRLKQFVYGMLFGVLRYATFLCNFFRQFSCVTLIKVVSFTQLGGLEQMEFDAMGGYLGGIDEHAELGAKKDKIGSKINIFGSNWLNLK